MHVAESKHLFEALLAFRFETAKPRRGDCVLQGAKECVPEREIGEIVGVPLELMMNPMRLWALHQKPEPARGANVPMIKIFAQRGEHGADRRGPRAAPEHEINQHAAQKRVKENLNRMLVKTGHDLDPPGGMMQLMTYAPEEMRFMAVAVPPIINKGRDQIGESATR